MLFTIVVILLIMELGYRIGVKIKDYIWMIVGVLLICVGVKFNSSWNSTLVTLMLGLGLCSCGAGVVGAIIDFIKWLS